jgi:hypothetical protein
MYPPGGGLAPLPDRCYTTVMFKLSYRLVTLIVAAVMLPAVTAAVGAIAQSYTTTADVGAGSLVRLVAKGGNAVEPATAPGGLVGVAVNQPALQLSSGGTASVQVAVGGTAQTLVSDINGAVNVGDRITASPVAGIGMKAKATGEVIGSAQASLASVATTTRTITDKAGKQTTIRVGMIPVAINVEYFSAGTSGNLSAFVPSFLQDLANSVAGKPVAPVRVLLSLVVLLLGSIVVIVMLNSAIRTGIISIGRNPLAGPALRRGLVDVILAALGIMLIAGLTVYALLAG